MKTPGAKRGETTEGVLGAPPEVPESDVVKPERKWLDGWLPRIAILGGVILLSIQVFVVTSSRTDLPRVDFSDTVAGAADFEGASRREELRIAVSTMLSPEMTWNYYVDLLGLIAGRLERRAVFAQRRTNAEINAMVAGGGADVAFVSSGSYVDGHEKLGMELLAVPVVQGETVYRSYIIVKQESPFNSFEELRGRRFAFADPDSNSGYLVPRYMLAAINETPETFFSETFFSQSHANSIRSIAKGLADGAAVDSSIWDFISEVDPAVTSHARIVAESPPYGIPPVVVHPGMDPDLKRRLKRVFLSLHVEDEAIPLLKQLRIDRFVEGNDGMYDTVREMRRVVSAIGESGL